jgi:hypothetical protein
MRSMRRCSNSALRLTCAHEGKKRRLSDVKLGSRLGAGWWRTPNHKTPETLRLTEPTPRPMLGMSGLLNLLTWVEHRQQVQALAYEEGGTRCPISHVIPSPPARFQTGHRRVGESTPNQSSTAAQASESPSRASVGAKPHPKQGGQ